MNIGVLTFYKVANFGANLQAVSTYLYLKKHGHNPVFINYMSPESLKRYDNNHLSERWVNHIKFVDKIIKIQTPVCRTSDDILKMVKLYSLDGIILGSDALLQHHPLIARIKRGRRKPFYVAKYDSDCMFPNPFWGCGISEQVRLGYLAVSSQNSEYKYFTKGLKEKMKLALSPVSYFSVRDEWTKNLLKSILPNREVNVSPDPVFAFNYNAKEFILSKDFIIDKFKIPENYVLISLHYQSLDDSVLYELNKYYADKGTPCIFLPIPNGQTFNHQCEFEIPSTIDPLEWYSLIKNAKAYIGSNMHPIVVSLHNAVPCYSIDNWGKENIFGRKRDDGSSKIKHIMDVFGVGQNHSYIENYKCAVNSKKIIDSIENFPVEDVTEKALNYYKKYLKIMSDIIESLTNQ